MQLFEYIDVLNTPYEIHTEEINDNDFYIKPHWHYFIEILYMIEGQISVECNGLARFLNCGDLLIIQAHTLHQIKSTNLLPARYDVIKFDLKFLKIPRAYSPYFRYIFSNTQENGTLFYPQKLIAETPVSDLIENCIDELRNRQFAYELNVQSNLSKLLVILIRLIENNRIYENSTNEEQINSFFFNVLEYIDAHSSETLHVHNLAKLSGMSYSNFAKKFKKQYGRSCKEYIEYIKISKAEEMVIYTEFDFNYIAQETGFSDYSHLIRTYKKFKNETPRQARLAAGYHNPSNWYQNR